MKQLLSAVLVLVLLGACSGSRYKNKALLTGQITVADSLDDSGDFSGIELVILYRDTSKVADTLVRARTDAKGMFKEHVSFPSPGRYPVEVRRFYRVISTSSVLLGDKDTVKIIAELPGFVQTAKIESREQAAFDTYQRLGRNYERIYQLAMAGRINPDTMPDIMRTWSKMYWELFEQRRGTYASKLAAAEALRLSAGISDSTVIARTEMLVEEPMLGQVVATAGMISRARAEGLDAALAFVDKMRPFHRGKEDQGSFLRLKCELLADSGRTAEALQLLEKGAVIGKEWKEFEYWRTARQKDLKMLAPGTPAPDFTVLVGKDSLRLSSLKGNLVLIEFTGLANPAYQEQFDRLGAIHLVYGKAGLKIVTIPMDQRPIIYEGFFQERERMWAFSEPGQYQASGVAEKYNVSLIPSRVLIDRKGNIVRKYPSASLELLFKDLQKQFAKDLPS